MIKSGVFYKEYKNIPLNIKEIKRYYGDKNVDNNVIMDAFSLVENTIEYKVIYKELPLKIDNNIIDFGDFNAQSKDLSKNLKNAKSVIVFLATIGFGIDREIKKYSNISPSKALLLQAIGTERVESICNTFCKDLRCEFGNIMPRFSAGYGDLKLDTQKDIFNVLMPNNIGVYLSENLIMTPSKSVTAFVGITDKNIDCKGNNCDYCSKENCEYRLK